MTAADSAITNEAISAGDTDVQTAVDSEVSSPIPDPRSPNPPEAPLPVAVIKPPKGWQPLDLPELWRYRELFLIFALRDIKVRYKQTVLGVGWALIQPIAFTIVGMVIFAGVAGAGNDNVTPAFLFYFASQIPWMLFDMGLQTS